MAKSPRAEKPSDPFTRRAVISSVVFVSVVFLALFLWYSVYVLFLLFAGVLVAVMLRGLADLVSQLTRLSHRWSLAIVLAVLIISATLFWFVAAKSLTGQLVELTNELPQAWENFQDRVKGTAIGHLVMGKPSPATQPTTQAVVIQGRGSGSTAGGGFLGGEPGELLRRFGGFISTFMDAAAALIVIVFTGLFLAFDPDSYVRGTIRMVPPPYRMRAGEVLGAIGYTLKWWLIGQGVTMIIIAVATWLGLLALGVPLALVLGVIAGVFNFIPNFGPLLSMVPATLLALTISPGTAIGVIVMFVILQNLEGNLLTPLIQRESVDLPPAVGIIAQILLSILVGAVGLMLAWPLAAVVVLLVKMLYIEDVLGDELHTPDHDPKVKEVREAKRQAREVAQDAKKE